MSAVEAPPNLMKEGGGPAPSSDRDPAGYPVRRSRHSGVIRPNEYAHLRSARPSTVFARQGVGHRHRLADGLGRQPSGSGLDFLSLAMTCSARKLHHSFPGQAFLWLFSLPYRTRGWSPRTGSLCYRPNRRLSRMQPPPGGRHGAGVLSHRKGSCLPCVGHGRLPRKHFVANDSRWSSGSEIRILRCPHLDLHQKGENAEQDTQRVSIRGRARPPPPSSGRCTNGTHPDSRRSKIH